MEQQAAKNKPRPREGYYSIKHGLFWTILPILVTGLFSFGHIVGSTRYDKNLIELSDNNKELKDSLKLQKKTIQYMRHNSDSALNIIAHMPYDQMKLDTSQFRKVQTNIESAGAVLSLNIHYKR